MVGNTAIIKPLQAQNDLSMSTIFSTERGGEKQEFLVCLMAVTLPCNFFEDI